MNKLYFILGFTLLTTSTFAQWQDLNFQVERNITLNSFGNYIQILENNDIYSIYTDVNDLNLNLLENPSQDGSYVSVTQAPSVSLKLIKYDGNFSNLDTQTLLGNNVYLQNGNAFGNLASNNNELYFSFRNSSAKLSVYKFNGTSWLSVGPSNISTQNVDLMRMGFTPDNRPFVIYRGFASGYSLNVKEYVAPNWIDVGLPIATTPYDPYAQIANDGTPYIAYEDTGVSNYILVKKYNSTTSSWDDLLSSSISTGVTYLQGLVIVDGMPYVSYSDNVSGTLPLRVKRFNGTNWELVGNMVETGNVFESVMKKTASGVIFVAYKKSDNLTVKRLVGNDWVAVGNESFSGSLGDGEFDFDVNDNHNCAVIFRKTITPKFLTFDGSTLTTKTMETGKIFDIKAYPNPVSNTLNIDTDLTINNIVIYNELGQLVMETKVKTIDTSSLSSGLYFVKVNTDEGTSYRTVKIIKN